MKKLLLFALTMVSMGSYIIHSADNQMQKINTDDYNQQLAEALRTKIYPQYKHYETQENKMNNKTFATLSKAEQATLIATHEKLNPIEKKKGKKEVVSLLTKAQTEGKVTIDGIEYHYSRHPYGSFALLSISCEPNLTKITLEQTAQQFKSSGKSLDQFIEQFNSQPSSS